MKILIIFSFLQVIKNELIFFRKFSDPSCRKKNEPRLHYYKLKILQVSWCDPLKKLFVCFTFSASEKSSYKCKPINKR